MYKLLRVIGILMCCIMTFIGSYLSFTYWWIGMFMFADSIRMMPFEYTGAMIGIIFMVITTFWWKYFMFIVSLTAGQIVKYADDRIST